MKYKELRGKVQNWQKWPGTVKLERAPLIHEGFPGNFNLSFAEYNWLKEFEGFTNIDHTFHFSSIQSCIRFNDFSNLDTVAAWKYLGVFDMADVTGMLAFDNKMDPAKIQEFNIRGLVEFLSSMGLDKKRMHPKYCAGGNVGDLTGGKYTFDFDVPEDLISKNNFLRIGIPEQNLIPDKTRDTLLALNCYGRPFPWGYRNEIEYNIGDDDNKKNFVDIGTVEYLPWAPIFKDKIISGLEETNCGSAVTAVGLERIAMVSDGLKRIQDVDHIKPVYDAANESNNEFRIENIRALHRIYSDIKHYGCEVGRHRRDKINIMIRNIPIIYSSDKIKDLLEVHSENQPWHPEMKDGIETTIEAIEKYRKNVK